MGRFGVLIPVLAAALATVVGALATQDATPEAEMTFEGATFELLAFGAVAELPSAPASFQLVRLRIEPGGRVSVPADDPGLVIIYVEAGTLTATGTAPETVMRGAAMATPGAQPFEEVAAGTEYSLGPGDSQVGQVRSGGEYRNDGPDEVVLLIAGIQSEGAATPAS